MKKSHSFAFRWTLRMAALVALLPAGCRHDGLDRVSIKGAILVDGKPLNSGAITFVPIEETRGPKASAKIVDGVYELGTREGPVVGKHRVEILADRELRFALDDPEDFNANAPDVLPPNQIPSQFNEHSQIVFEAVAGRTNAFSFTIPAN